MKFHSRRPLPALLRAPWSAVSALLGVTSCMCMPCLALICILFVITPTYGHSMFKCIVDINLVHGPGARR